LENHYELVLGTKNRSGKDWDAWEAVYSPQGEDGYPKRLWDKKTGAPTRKTLEDLGLQDVADELARMGKIP
jgi:hypothetical protein